jgi:hypothetical protein
VHFLQIWIVPEREGLEPGYEQKSFPEEDRQGKFRLLGSRDGRDGSVTIHQDVDVQGALLDPDQAVTFDLRPDRKLWVQLAHGTVIANGQTLYAGDGLGILATGEIAITATDNAEILLFDLAA